MIAHLTVACACGRTATAPCATIADIPAAQSKFDGWGYDERGFARCPECLAGHAVTVTPAPARVRQGELFAGESA